MTVTELITALSAMPLDLIVAWDYDYYEYWECRGVSVRIIPANMHPRAIGTFTGMGTIPEGVPGRVDEHNGMVVELLSN